VADNPNVELAVRLVSWFFVRDHRLRTNKMMWSPYRDSCLGPGALGMVSPSAIENLDPPKENVTTVGTLRHELGHVLGFRHEHPWAPLRGGCNEDPTDVPTDITGRRLTPYDQVSVMHYLDCGGVAGIDYTLSIQDGIGARKIYGMPASWHVALQGVSAFL
jgi:hypothetical protein